MSATLSRVYLLALLKCYLGKIPGRLHHGLTQAYYVARVNGQEVSPNLKAQSYKAALGTMDGASSSSSSAGLLPLEFTFVHERVDGDEGCDHGVDVQQELELELGLEREDPGDSVRSCVGDGLVDVVASDEEEQEVGAPEGRAAEPGAPAAEAPQRERQAVVQDAGEGGEAAPARGPAPAQGRLFKGDGTLLIRIPFSLDHTTSATAMTKRLGPTWHIALSTSGAPSTSRSASPTRRPCAGGSWTGVSTRRGAQARLSTHEWCLRSPLLPQKWSFVHSYLVSISTQQMLYCSTAAGGRVSASAATAQMLLRGARSHEPLGKKGAIVSSYSVTFH